MRPAVSNKGRYRSYSGKISKGQLRKQDGRHYVQTTNAQAKHVTYVLARLIKLAFHGPPDDPAKIDVGHLDHDKANDELDNLEWRTHQQNRRGVARRRGVRRHPREQHGPHRVPDGEARLRL